MKNYLLVFLLSSFVYTQMIPDYLIPKLKISDIPKHIPSVEIGKHFKDYAISHEIDSGIEYFAMLSMDYKDYIHFEIDDSIIPNGGYLILIDPDIECIYGPYTSKNSNYFYSDMINTEKLIVKYFEPYQTDILGNFIIQDIITGKALPSQNERVYEPNFFIMNHDRDRPVLLVTGYWPPTNEMLRHFSQNPELNPDGWEGENWNGLGFDVVSYFPEFNPPDCTDCGQGYGDLEVDYQDTSEDFWAIVEDEKPFGIITFSRGFNNYSWEIENNLRNRNNWYADYTTPFFPTPTPPDDSVEDNYNRNNALPMDEIIVAIENSGLAVDPYIDENGGAGMFLSEFMGYHGMWYHQINTDTEFPCLTGGHIHVGGQVSTRLAQDAAEVTIATVLDYLSQYIFINGDVNQDQILNIQDVIMLINYILGNLDLDDISLQLADLNQDGNLNIQDVILLVDIILD